MPSIQKTTKILRTFCEFTDEDVVDSPRVAARLAPHMPGSITWPELLKSRRILLIAEAGAGKTYECRRQHEQLWDSGEPAFFFELTTLANIGLRDGLSFEEGQRFDTWLASQSDVATFFFDSIDELNLTRGSFEQALRRFNKDVAGQLVRARIIITTRPIPFDQDAVRRFLPMPDAAEKNDFSAEQFADFATGRRRPKEPKQTAPVWRNVGLMPFNSDQMRQMAVMQKGQDVDALMADIHRRNAEDFTRRPQDLMELCVDWREAKRIRTHREQVAQNIRIKLLPRKTEQMALTPDKAREGARRLALAALLGRKLIIRHSAEADRDGSSEQALNPEIILGDWTAQERKTLLERSYLDSPATVVSAFTTALSSRASLPRR